MLADGVRWKVDGLAYCWRFLAHDAKIPDKLCIESLCFACN